MTALLPKLIVPGSRACRAKAEFTCHAVRVQQCAVKGAVLRYLVLGFATFGAAAVLAHPDWPRLLEASLVPALSLRPGEAGTTFLSGTATYRRQIGA